jgi:hypothetical protein
MDELLRQQGLLAALERGDDAIALSLRETGERAARGLDAYRANAEAIAERALAGAFATVQALVGVADFAQLARAFRRIEPPGRGDLGEWGDAFPAWLQAHPALARWPYLGDCARLDWALHCSERAADSDVDTASLAWLASTDPARLRLRLRAGTALLRSAWPIARIHRAHQLHGAAAEQAFAQVRDAVAAARGDDVMVVREGWRAVVHPLDAAGARWLESLLDGASLSAALEGAGDGFDFAAWLQAALRASWLQGVAVSND